MRPTSATLADVAREAGVSLATASRAFNGSTTRTVREDLRLRVLDAATGLGYSPNTAAQAMVRGRTDVIGLVVSDIADPYFATIAAGVMAAAEEAGQIVTLGSTQRRPSRESDYVAAHRAQRSRAVILAGSRVSDAKATARLGTEVAAYQRSGGRVVAISQPILDVDTVVVENRAGARQLASTLVGRGYHRFAVLAGPTGLATSKDRVEGFRAGLRSAGTEAPAVIRGDFTRDGGYAAMARLIERDDIPECVFAVNDVMAVGAMAACRERGLRLPRDVALAGFDDIATLRDVCPGLTTVRLPLDRLGREAVGLVLSDSTEPQRLSFTGDVVVRESTPVRRG